VANIATRLGLPLVTALYECARKWCCVITCTDGSGNGCALSASAADARKVSNAANLASLPTLEERDERRPRDAQRYHLETIVPQACV